MPDVRKATAADIDALAAMLARAFDDDPIYEFLFPQRNRPKTYARFFAHGLRSRFLAYDQVWTTTDGVRGAAVWTPPGKWRMSHAEVLRSAPATARLFGRLLPRALRAFNAVDGAHPPGHHFYLGVLGTDPVAQRTGVGSAVLDPVLRRCDDQGIGAYLESSKEQNVAFYNRHGFEVTRELRLPGGGPSVWLMWRDPQPGRART